MSVSGTTSPLARGAGRMSSTSIEQTKTTAQDGFGSAGTSPSNSRRSASGDRLYRVVWRWHFYAAMIITLPLIVVAATGALYIFKDEVEGVLHPGVLYVEPAGGMGKPQEIAAAVVWLCSEEAAFMVGHAMVIGGGQTIQ